MGIKTLARIKLPVNAEFNYDVRKYILCVICYMTYKVSYKMYKISVMNSGFKMKTLILLKGFNLNNFVFIVLRIIELYTFAFFR